MTYTIIYFMCRKPGLSLEEFKDHYQNKHLPLFKDMLDNVKPINRTAHYLKPDNTGPPAGANAVEYDCITFLEFRDENHFNEFSEFVNASRHDAEIVADEEVFADMSKFRAMRVEAPEATES